MSEEVSSTLKIPVFNGEAQKFQSWMIRFLSYSRVKGFSTTLMMSSELPTSEEEIGTLNATNSDEKKKIATGKQNTLVMAHLTMTLGTELLLNKVTTVCDDSWPGGLAYKLIKNIKEEYQPEDRVSAVEIKRKMSK
eukprot:15342333-Ditylum_brightwellii.AAC.1